MHGQGLQVICSCFCSLCILLHVVVQINRMQLCAIMVGGLLEVNREDGGGAAGCGITEGQSHQAAEKRRLDLSKCRERPRTSSLYSMTTRLSLEVSTQVT